MSSRQANIIFATNVGGKVRIENILLRNLDNEKIVIRNEVTDQEVTMTPEQFRVLLAAGAMVLSQ